MPESDKGNIRRFFKPKTLSKGSFVSKAGGIPLYHNFLVSGYLRKYHVNDSGEEVTTDLNNGPRFFTSYFLFLNQTVSNENLECLTDCEILQISMPDVANSAKTSVNQQTYNLKLFEQIIEEKRSK